MVRVPVVGRPQHTPIVREVTRPRTNAHADDRPRHGHKGHALDTANPGSATRTCTGRTRPGAPPAADKNCRAVSIAAVGAYIVP